MKRTGGGKRLLLLIVDYYMPGIEGEESFRQIFKLDNIPVIVVTGDYLEETNTIIEYDRVRGIFKKPLEIDKFLKLSIISF